MATAPLLLNRISPQKEIYYQESDGKPMAETDEHRIAASEVLQMLADRYAQTDTYIAGNNFIYYVEGNPNKRVSPDAYVVFAVGSQPRRVYKTWDNDHKAPAVVFEFTSKQTKKEDVEKKRTLYEQILRVPEYFLFDPDGEYLKPRLQGLRLQNGIYVPIEMRDSCLYSEQLGLELFADGLLLRLRDPKTGHLYLTSAEKSREIEEQNRRLESEARRADEAEARLAEDWAEIERLRALLSAAQGKSGSA